MTQSDAKANLILPFYELGNGVLVVDRRLKVGFVRAGLTRYRWLHDRSYLFGRQLHLDLTHLAGSTGDPTNIQLKLEGIRV